MKLITEVHESIEYISEANEDGEKEFFIEGVFMQANQKNRNGRVYPTEVLQREVTRYNKEYVEKNRAFGELGHPQGPTINLERVSHMIKELKQDGGSLGVSSRGMGSLKAKNGVNEVQSDFYLATAADIVADPSAPDAFVEGIMEGVEWVYEGGKWVEQFIEQAQQEIHSVSKAELEETKLRVFENFLKRL